MKHTDGISDVAILGMGTALPVHSVAQSDIADLIASTRRINPIWPALLEEYFDPAVSKLVILANPTTLVHWKNAAICLPMTSPTSRLPRNEWIHTSGRPSRLA